MVTIERICFTPHYHIRDSRSVIYVPRSSSAFFDGLPQIFWTDGTPWREANLWATERLSSGEASLKTIVSNMNGLLNYAKFLEAHNMHWFAFPTRKADRCLVLYRGALIKLRNIGSLSPSTASEYMRNCIMFYRWVRGKQLLGPHASLWKEKPYIVKFFDQVGFERMFSGVTTDLRIPNRRRPGITLEGGLLPVSESDRQLMLDFTEKSATPELYLMLALGFFTGMRLGSICDLKIQTLEHAIPDPTSDGLLRIAIGPGATPPVHTKLGVTGQVWIPQALRDVLLEYVLGWRRMERESKAASENRDLVFLTRFGNSYSRRGSDQSSAVNMEMSGLRKKGVVAGVAAFRKFRFHQTRCTFGTVLAKLALSACDDTSIVIAMVGEALLHGPSSESTTFKYIKFVQSIPAKQALSKSFMSAFTGVVTEKARDE